MSELTWYSRFAVWVGAAVLLVQSLAGRGAGLMSLLAVLLMGGGLVGFLAGLWWDEHRPGMGVLDAAPVTVAPPHEEAEPREAAAPPAAPEQVEAEAETPAAQIVVPSDEQTTPAEPRASTPLSASAAPARVETEDLDAESRLIGVLCVRCDRALDVGQVAATCPECGTPQHASCWIENHFRCSTPGCSGGGSLEAPGRPQHGPTA